MPPTKMRFGTAVPYRGAFKVVMVPGEHEGEISRLLPLEAWCWPSGGGACCCCPVGTIHAEGSSDEEVWQKCEREEKVT